MSDVLAGALCVLVAMSAASSMRTRLGWQAGAAVVAAYLSGAVSGTLAPLAAAFSFAFAGGLVSLRSGCAASILPASMQTMLVTIACVAWLLPDASHLSGALAALGGLALTRARSVAVGRCLLSAAASGNGRRLRGARVCSGRGAGSSGCGRGRRDARAHRRASVARLGRRRAGSRWPRRAPERMVRSSWRPSRLRSRARNPRPSRRSRAKPRKNHKAGAIRAGLLIAAACTQRSPHQRSRFHNAPSTKPTAAAISKP